MTTAQKLTPVNKAVLMAVMLVSMTAFFAFMFSIISWNEPDEIVWSSFLGDKTVWPIVGFSLRTGFMAAVAILAIGAFGAWVKKRKSVR